MKTSITIYSLSQYFSKDKMDVEGFIKYCSSLGVDAVDLGYYWKDEDKEVGLVPQWLEQNKLKLGAYIIGNDFVQKEKVKRDETINEVKHAIDRAKQLQVGILRVFAGNVKEGYSTYEQAKDVLVDSFKQVVEYAKNKRVILALENHGVLCGKADQILDLLKAVGDSDYLKLNIDIGNFMPVGENPLDSIPKLAHLAVHTHIKDFKKVGDKLVSSIVGEGDVDLKGCMKILKQNNYSGYLSIEYEAEQDSKVGTEKSLANLREALRGI